MKKEKLITILLSIFTIICIICYIGKFVFVGRGTSLHLNYESVNEIYDKDKYKLVIVSQFFIKSGFEKIYIPYAMKSGMMSVEGVNKYIKEPEIVKTIEELKSHGYNVIGKNGNTVFFQIWADLDSGRGIAYSINGEEPKLEFLTKHKPLPDDNWYYYEEDYNTWRNNNTTNGIPNYLLGEWSIQYAKTRGTGETSEEYPLYELYDNEELDYGVKIVFNSDGTFVRSVGNPFDEASIIEGTYILRYENKILLKHKDGTQSTVKYIMETEELVYYTKDDDLTAINEYYKRQ